MDMNNEKWINEVMNSLDDVKSAEANPFLYTRILSKISSGNVEHTPLKLVWLAAASFLLLVMLNFSIIKKVYAVIESIFDTVFGQADIKLFGKCHP